MTNTCKKHNRYSCYDYDCKREQDQNNAGQIGVDLQGDLNMGLGGGMTMDLTDGSIGMNIGGINIDFDGQ